MLVLAAGVEPGGVFSKAEPLGLVPKSYWRETVPL